MQLTEADYGHVMGDINDWSDMAWLTMTASTWEGGTRYRRRL